MPADELDDALRLLAAEKLRLENLKRQLATVQRSRFYALHALLSAVLQLVSRRETTSDAHAGDEIASVARGAQPVRQ